jgi:hypothetical protein
MQVTGNSESTIYKALQQMLELELFSNHSVQMQILQFGAISSLIQMQLM